MSMEGENEILDVQLGWKAIFDNLQAKYAQLLSNNSPRVSDVARTMYSMIPSAYLDQELHDAWKKYFIPKKELDMNKEEHQEKMSELLRAFMDWSNRNNMWVKKEFIDQQELLWHQVKELADEGDMEELMILLGIEEEYDTD